jgi:hypothetical protein
MRTSRYALTYQSRSFPVDNDDELSEKLGVAWTPSQLTDTAQRDSSPPVGANRNR